MANAGLGSNSIICVVSLKTERQGASLVALEPVAVQLDGGLCRKSLSGDQPGLTNCVGTYELHRPKKALALQPPTSRLPVNSTKNGFPLI
ncbi:MAG: hypothetical protein ACI87E_004145 [Mariniblastus sp.]|jgi:hypothetical protein